LTLPPPALLGSFQMRNAAVALAALERLSLGEKPPVLPEFPAAALGLGMKTVQWPARLQRLTAGPLVDLLPDNWELYLDGGHNPHAAEAIARHVRSWRDKPLLGVFGILANKDVDGYLGHMATRFHSLRTVAIPGEAATLSAEDAALCATKHFAMDAKPADCVDSALRDLIAGHAGPARVLICGSLYLAGKVLADNS
jgi:dihydrofolate synthase/folylpolyglutamate synthase